MVLLSVKGYFTRRKRSKQNILFKTSGLKLVTYLILLKIAKILSFKLNVIQVLKLEQTSLSTLVTYFFTATNALWEKHPWLKAKIKLNLKPELKMNVI